MFRHSHESRHHEGCSSPRFHLAGAKTHYLPDRHYDIVSLTMVLKPDFETKSLSAQVTYKVKALTDQRCPESITLEQRELNIQRVHSQGQDLKFGVTDETLSVFGLQDKDGHAEFTVEYSSVPRWCLFYVGPDASFPEKSQQLWSLCQDENARYWFPCLDHPSWRFAVDMTVEVPAHMMALSNGRLAQDEVSGDTRRMQWQFDKPLPPYLLTLVVGEFVVIEDQWKDIPVRFLAPPEREHWARLSLSKTTKMIDFLSNWTGVDYPWSRYDQIVVYDYHFGGMEHTTATTLTELTLRDERALLDSSSESLVSHELAHQWFGNLVTCREWAHGWLNEGFATYSENLWMEHEHGHDEARYHMLSKVLSGYLGEASGRYVRPIVDRQYHQAIDLFDAHLYEKGACVLHALRGWLGDEGFQKTVRHYLAKHRGQTVHTIDLMRAVSEATGVCADGFFMQWVFSAGHVSLESNIQWDDDNQLLTLSLKQNQDQKEHLHAYRLKLDLHLKVGDEWQERRLDMQSRQQNFVFSLPEKPSVVSLDPGAHLLGTLSQKASSSWLISQLQHDRSVVGRARAARALAKHRSHASFEALKTALNSDSFWGVQAEAATALGKHRSSKARAALVSALKLEHPKARKAVVVALGEFVKEPDAAAALREVLDGDASYFVEAAAAKSLGKIGLSEDLSDMLELLLDRDSWHDVVRAGVIEGLGHLGLVEDCLHTVIAYSGYGHSLDVRRAAIGALTSFASTSFTGPRQRIIEHLIRLSYDREFRVQISAAKALGKLGAGQAVGPLNDLIDREIDARVIRHVREALKMIQSKQTESGKLESLSQALNEERALVRDLIRRLDQLEARVEASEE